MANLIELKEAAKMLGITPDELTDMRSRNEVFGYRDGSTWKFKEQEIERVAQQLGVDLSAGGASADSDNFDLDLSDDSIELEGLDVTSDGGDEGDSILVSEEELGKSADDTASSTIIGKPDPADAGASDIRLAETLDDGSALRLTGDSDADAASDLTVGASDILSPDSDILGGADSNVGPSDTANLFGEGSELKLSSSSGSLDFSIEDSEISLDSPGGSGINLSSESQAGTSGFGSAIDLDLDDDELVLGSGTGSDVTSGAGDSGISLSNPADSGLSLEQPLDLSGGSSIESLELGEDDIIAIDEPADTEVPTDLGGDDDFLLTPMSNELDEESDSGSQVIDLDSEEFDESAATLLADNASPMDELGEGVAFETLDDGDEFGGDGLVELDADGLDADGGFDDAPLGGASAAAALSTAGRGAPEAHYSLANVLSLFGIVCVLGLAGLMMLDLITNMWSWDQNYAFKSTLMDTIISMIPGSSK